MSTERGYHHGDLRTALVQASFELLADGGLQRFSVAAVARRLGVSSAAPYRHFPDRAHLLGAVSAAAARDLGTAITAAADAAGPDPAERLAAVAGAYVRYVARTGAGFQVIYAAELYDFPDDARREQTRALMTTLIDLATATGSSSFQEALQLVEATIAVAHGYTSLLADGFFARKAHSADAVADRATAATRALVTRPRR
ncbi:TetR/AcrR family transcriptional regulator [Couchioplanes caeruleus]|uniref:TetR family transcriptional regulator n=2 Tax=Couchioplanes caeruleus TaxID=56438 RepID=A0A1K0GH33_9ACTN|nr:TetR/AcrR family transcriptional regulator [Couchioplanes caeruleus]OJF10188.1 TetR family transcriptional regulator [Couchioplanes caeruleus subsp. caeruleus]ROP28821.1 TetR family transcriptional regulator [Couchioplanes caeruleus]